MDRQAKKYCAHKKGVFLTEHKYEYIDAASLIADSKREVRMAGIKGYRDAEVLASTLQNETVER